MIINISIQTENERMDIVDKIIAALLNPSILISTRSIFKFSMKTSGSQTFSYCGTLL